MTFGKLFGLGFLLWVLFGALHYVFFKVLSFDSTAVHITYWFLIFVVTTAVVRRLGVINYLEAIGVTLVWVIMVLVLDGLLLSPSFGKVMFGSSAAWYGYLVLGLTVFVMHKKRHIDMRHQAHAHGHGHGGGHEHGGHKSHGDHHQQPHGHKEPGKHH